MTTLKEDAILCLIGQRCKD